MGKFKIKLIIATVAILFCVGLGFFMINGGLNKDYRVSDIMMSGLKSDQIQICDKVGVLGEDAGKLSGMLKRCVRNGENIAVVIGYYDADFEYKYGSPNYSKKDTYFVELHIREGFTRVYKRKPLYTYTVEELSYSEMDYKAVKLMNEHDYVGSVKQLLKEIIRNQKEQQGVLAAVQEGSILMILLLAGILILYIIVRRGREVGIKTRTNVDDISSNVRFSNTTTVRTGTKETPKYNTDYDGSQYSYSRNHQGIGLLDLLFKPKRK